MPLLVLVRSLKIGDDQVDTRPKPSVKVCYKVDIVFTLKGGHLAFVESNGVKNEYSLPLRVPQTGNVQPARMHGPEQ
jgi:hypothetical protein